MIHVCILLLQCLIVEKLSKCAQMFTANPCRYVVFISDLILYWERMVHHDGVLFLILCVEILFSDMLRCMLLIHTCIWT